MDFDEWLQHTEMEREAHQREMEMELDDLEDFTLMTMCMSGPHLPRERVPRQIVPRDHHDGFRRIWADYFAPQPVYGDRLFRERSIACLCYIMLSAFSWRVD
jgi:hypothetical protein